jgi:heme A synthase
MYELTLTLHSWLRWGAVLAGIGATVVLFLSGRDSKAAAQGDRWGLIFMIMLDLQLLLGLLLYFALSPITSAIFDNFGAAMRDPAARFWAVEHVTLMLFAVVIAHVGRVLARKAATPAAKRTRLLVCFTLATIAVLAATPWPGMPAGRPLFRL